VAVAGPYQWVGNVSKFSSQVSHTLQQLTGDITLNVPNIVIESVAQAMEDYDVIVALENAVQEWAAVLTSAIKREMEKTATGGDKQTVRSRVIHHI